MPNGTLQELSTVLRFSKDGVATVQSGLNFDCDLNSTGLPSRRGARFGLAVLLLGSALIFSACARDPRSVVTTLHVEPTRSPVRGTWAPGPPGLPNMAPYQSPLPTFRHVWVRTTPGRCVSVRNLQRSRTQSSGARNRDVCRQFSARPHSGSRRGKLK